MVDIVTDFSSVDDDWHYLALVEDVRSGVDVRRGSRLVAGSHDEQWTVEVTDVGDELVRFKLVEPVRGTAASPPRAAG